MDTHEQKYVENFCKSMTGLIDQDIINRFLEVSDGRNLLLSVSSPALTAAIIHLSRRIGKI